MNLTDPEFEGFVGWLGGERRPSPGKRTRARLIFLQRDVASTHREMFALLAATQTTTMLAATGYIDYGAGDFDGQSSGHDYYGVSFSGKRGGRAGGKLRFQSWRAPRGARSLGEFCGAQRLAERDSRGSGMQKHAQIASNIFEFVKPC